MRKKHRKKTGGQQAFLRGFRGSFDCGPPQSTKDTKRTSTTAQNETTGKHRQQNRNQAFAILRVFAPSW